MSEGVAEKTIASLPWKKYLPWILLAAFLVFGWYLRAYHLDYPVIGYHNWKETHYLTEARNFAREGFFAHGFFVPAWDLPFVNEDLSGAHADTFPMISVLGALVYRVFDADLGALRGIGVILNLASMVVFYLLIKRLFHREDLALASAALFALNPLMIFFSRNFQLDSPALFYMLLGTYFLVRWVEQDHPKWFVLAALFTVLGIVTKYSFVVMAFPFLAMFPYRRLWEWKARLKTFLPVAGFGVLLLAWFVYMEVYFKGKIKALYGVSGGAVITIAEMINFKEVFTATFWMAMQSFIADNFTKAGMLIAIVGFLLLAYRYIIQRQVSLGNKYVFFYGAFGILFTIILASKLGGHSYHQFPYAPLIVFLIAYAFVVIANTVAGLVRIPHVSWIVMALLIGTLWAPTTAALDRQFGTIFPGLDVAGRYVNENSSPDERIMHSSHQSYGILWHADRKGYKVPTEVDQLKKAEDAGATWIFLYQWKFDLLQNEEWMEYVSNNYAMKQVGFVTPNGQFQPYY
ncbi:glycosyltransferase family 39 protein, partial [Candidatus Woesearchaeota archaeon]|nr:glycosyltransferase family 39 protein [Candidatus Woesearchaeota archaeon]